MLNTCQSRSLSTTSVFVNPRDWALSIKTILVIWELCVMSVPVYIHEQATRTSLLWTVYTECTSSDLCRSTGNQGRKVSWLLWSANCWRGSVCLPQELLCQTLSSLCPLSTCVRLFMCFGQWECVQWKCNHRQRGTWVIADKETVRWTQSRSRFLFGVWPLCLDLLRFTLPEENHLNML